MKVLRLQQVEASSHGYTRSKYLKQTYSTLAGLSSREPTIVNLFSNLSLVAPRPRGFGRSVR
jgi:hypothetical protein